MEVERWRMRENKRLGVGETWKHGFQADLMAAALTLRRFLLPFLTFPFIPVVSYFTFSSTTAALLEAQDKTLNPKYSTLYALPCLSFYFLLVISLLLSQSVFHIKDSSHHLAGYS